MDILVVVDMQNDFISGALGSDDAKSIVGNVKEKIDNFKGKIIFTRDTHYEDYLSTQEGKNLPIKHCIIGSEGHKIHPALNSDKHTVIDKITFGSSKLIEELININNKEKIESITFIGLCTDICVISNALTTKTFLPQVPIIVDEKCCAGVTKQSHNTAIEAMKACQIQII